MVSLEKLFGAVVIFKSSTSNVLMDTVTKI